MFILKKIALKNTLMLASITLLTSCSSFYFDEFSEEDEPFVGTSEMQNIEEQIIQVPVEDELYSFHTHKKVDDYTDKLAHDLIRNLRDKLINSPIVVTSFVYFDDTLQRTDKTGNLISESLVGQVQEYGLPVMDIHLMGGVNITNKGDFAFSRDVSDIIYADSIKYVLSGVMVKTEQGIKVNARILEMDSKLVISNASTLIPYFVIEAI